MPQTAGPCPRSRPFCGRWVSRAQIPALLFFPPPPADDPSPKAQTLRVKLAHINAAAKLESPEYRGPFLPADALGAAGPPGDRASQLQSGLREALAGVLGGHDKGRFDVPTVYGWQIGERALSPRPPRRWRAAGPRRGGYIPSRRAASDLSPPRSPVKFGPRPLGGGDRPAGCHSDFRSPWAPRPFPVGRRG